MLEFYYWEFSPPCRGVWMTLKQLGIKFDKRIIDLTKGEHKNEDFLNINPHGKVPAIRHDGFAIAESRAIAAYICDVFDPDSKNNLYPKDAQQRATVNKILLTDLSQWNAIISYINAVGVIQGGQQPNYEELPKVRAALKRYELFLNKSEFIAADHITIADFFAFTTLSSLEIIDFQEWSNYPAILRWMGTMRNLPYHEECNVAPVEPLQKLYRSKLHKGTPF